METGALNLPAGFQLEQSAQVTPPPGFTLEKPMGEAESFGRGAANNVPLVPQAIAGLEKGPYSQNLQDWNAKAGAAHKDNPWSYDTGAVTAGALPSFIP